MNREIKFRAWDGTTMLMNIGVHPSISMVHEGYEPGQEGRMTISPVMKAYNIMQFTGLKDMTGKEIYEGDMIHRHMNVHWEVRFTKDRWQAHPKYESGLWLDTDQFQEAAIVGNIHESARLGAVAPTCR